MRILGIIILVILITPFVLQGLTKFVEDFSHEIKNNTLSAFFFGALTLCMVLYIL